MSAMSDLNPMHPARSKLDGVAVLNENSGGFASKMKIRYLVEKEIDGQWIIMARLSGEADRITELCEALGGKIRVLDLAGQKSVVVLQEEFE